MTRFEQQSQEFKQILDEIYELFISKGKDYGNPNDHYANLRESARIFLPDKPAWVAPLIRLMDKIIRTQNILRNGKAENEPLKDSIRDIATYGLESYAMYLEEQKK